MPQVVYNNGIVSLLGIFPRETEYWHTSALGTRWARCGSVVYYSGPLWVPSIPHIPHHVAPIWREIHPSWLGLGQKLPKPYKNLEMKEMHKLRISSWLVHDTSSSIYSPPLRLPPSHISRDWSNFCPEFIFPYISHTSYIFLTCFKLWSQGMGDGRGKLAID